MVPLFVIPPAMLPAPKTVTAVTSMPPWLAMIFPSVDDAAENCRDVEQVDAGPDAGGDGARVRYSATGAAAAEQGILAEVNAHTREIAAEIVPALLIPPAKVVTSLTSMPLEACCNPAAGGVANVAGKDRGVEDGNAVVEMPVEIVPLLVMPPANVIVFSTTIPLEPAEILP